MVSCSTLPASYPIVIRHTVSIEPSVQWKDKIEETYTVFLEKEPYQIAYPSISRGDWPEAVESCKKLQPSMPCYVQSNCALALLMAHHGDPFIPIATARQLCPDSDLIENNFRTILVLTEKNR